MKGRPGAVDGYRQQKLISTVEVPAGVRWSSSTQVVPLEDIQVGYAAVGLSETNTMSDA